MKNLKRILSLILVVLTLVPLVLTTGISSVADGNISSGTVVSTSEGWQTNWTAYTNNGSVFGVYSSGQTGNGCTPGSIKLSDTDYTYGGAAKNNNFSCGIGNYTNTENILGTTFNFSVLNYGYQSIISFAFCGNKNGVKTYPETVYYAPHNYLGYFKQVYTNGYDGLGINLRLNADGTVQTISGWFNALGSCWLLDSYQGNNAILNIGADKTNTIEFTSDYHLKINGTVYDSFNCYQNHSGTKNTKWTTFSGLFHDYCVDYKWSANSKYLAFGMYSAGDNRCQARLNAVKNSPAINYDKKFQITYNTDGGDAISATKLRFGEAYTLPTPTKSGYTFKQWNITTTGGTSITKHAGDTGSYDTYGDWTATAVWELITTPEARIGTTEYNSLATALDEAQNGDTVTILKDVEASSILYITSKDITIDLNGFSVYNHTNSEVFIPQAGAKVRFTGNGSVYSENSNDSGRTGKAINPDASEVIIENGTYYAVNTSTTNATNAVNYVIQARNGSTITINGGTFYGKRSSSDGKFRPVIYSDNSTINISSGVVHYDDRGTYPFSYTSADLLKIANGGTISVTGGSFGQFSPSAFINTSTHEVSPITDGYYNVVPAGQKYNVGITVNSSAMGSASAEPSITYADETVTLSAIPNQGYKFVNWTSDDVTINNATSPTAATFTMPAKDVTVKANFAALATYTVKYYKNNSNATGTMSDETKTEGVDYEIKNCAFTIAGYNFAGWNTKSDGTGTDYNAGAIYTVDANLSLYAKWVLKTTTITLDKNGGEADVVITATYSKVLSAFTAVTYPGRTLNGYYTAPTGGTKIINANGTLVKSVSGYSDGNEKWKNESTSMTLYAQWTIKTTAITLNKNGGSANGSATATYDSSSLTITNAKHNTLTLVGYFTGTGDSEKIINNNGTLVSDTTYTDVDGNWHSELESLTLYAHWASATYTVTYSCGKYSTGSDVTDTKYAGTALTLRGVTFTRPGYVQSGWSTSFDGGQQTYALEAGYTTDADTTLYPCWTDVPYVHEQDSPFKINNLHVIDNGTYDGGTTIKAPSWLSDVYLRSADINDKKQGQLLTRTVFIEAESATSANGGFVTVNDHLGTYQSDPGGATSSAIQFGENSRVLLANKPSLTFSLPENMSDYAGSVFDIGFVFDATMTIKLKTADQRVINIQNGNYGFNYSFIIDGSGNVTNVDFFFREGGDANKTYFFANNQPANPVKLEKKNNTLTFNDSGHLLINGVDVMSDSWTSNIIVATSGINITSCLNKALSYTNLPMLLAFGAGSNSATGRYSFTINDVNSTPAVNVGKAFTGTIDKNGATETVSDFTCNYGDEFTLPVLSKPNYEFAGYDYSYSKNADESDTGTYDADDLTHNYLNVGDAVFTAKFTGCQYTVTFDATGGAASFNTKQVSYGEAIGELPTATPPVGTLKVFVGWYTAATGGDRITSSSIVSVASSFTLYAHWADCIITLNKGSDGDTDGIAYIAPNDTAVTNFTAVVPKTSYSIIGYYTTNSATTGIRVLDSQGVFASTNVSGYITNGKWTYSGNSLTLYAVCEIYIPGYNIRYYANSRLLSKVGDYKFNLTGDGFNGATFDENSVTGKDGLYRDENRYFWTSIGLKESYGFPKIATDPDGNKYYESSLGVGYVASNGTRYYLQTDVGKNKSTGSTTGRFKLTQDYDSRDDYKSWVRVEYAMNFQIFGNKTISGGTSYYNETVDPVLGCLPNFLKFNNGSPATWNLYPNYYRESYCSMPDDAYGLYDLDGSNKFYSVSTSWDLGVRYTDGQNRYVYTFIPNLYDNDTSLGNYCLLPSDIANKVGWALPNQVISYWFIDLDGDGVWKDVDGDGDYDKADGDEPKYDTGHKFNANNYLYSRQVATKEFSQYVEAGANKAPVTLTAHWEETDVFTLSLDGSGYDSSGTEITYRDALTHKSKTVSLSGNNPRTVYCEKNSQVSIVFTTSTEGELAYLSADDQNTHTNIVGNSRYLLVSSQMTEANKDIPVSCPSGSLSDNALKNKYVLINNKRYKVDSNTTSTITLSSSVRFDQNTLIFPDTTGSGRIIGDCGAYTEQTNDGNRKYSYGFTITSDYGLTATFASREDKISTPVLDRNNKLLKNSSDTNILYPSAGDRTSLGLSSTAIPNYYLYGGNSDCTVTVSNSDLMSSVSAKYDTNVTVVTSLVKNNQSFVCWKINGLVVSFSSLYTFKVTGNITIEAVYSATATKDAGIAIISNSTDSSKITVLSHRSAKQGITCIESGYLIHKNANGATVYGQTAMEDELDNVNIDTGRYTSYKVISTDTNREGDFRLMMPSDLGTGESYSIIAYYTYKNSSGVINTVYSNSITVPN